MPRTLARRSARLALTIAVLAGVAPRIAPAQVSLGVNNILHVGAPGPATSNCLALRDVLSSITDSSPTNRYTVRLEPGMYDCGTQAVGVPPAVALEGWGQEIVSIVGSIDNAFLGVVHLLDRSALRGLTVENQLTTPQNGGMAVSAWSLGGQAWDIHVEDVRLIAADSGPKDYALFVSNGKVSIRYSTLQGLVRAESGSVGSIEYSTMEEKSTSSSTVGCRFIYASGFGELDDLCLVAP